MLIAVSIVSSHESWKWNDGWVSLQNRTVKQRTFVTANTVLPHGLCTVIGHLGLGDTFSPNANLINHLDSIAILILPVDVACWFVVYHAMAPFSAQRLPKRPHAALTTCIAPRLTPNGRGTPRTRLSHHLRRVCARAGDRTIMAGARQPPAVCNPGLGLCE